MEKPSYKLVGAPCGHHGQYTFYKALRICGKHERILAIGDFFFVRVWQDSELVSVGELQLLWTDRVSDQTLVSLRLYFLPENTPDGRNQHGEDEVLAINDKVVVRVEDLLSWICSGEDWRWGLRAVWRGDCTPPAEPKGTAPLHCSKLDFSDIDKEKSAIEVDTESPGVVVFSYPRYCRYRALLCRLEGIQAAWLRDSLVAALGGYSAPTKNTRILYCKDTFEYQELEGHEFVCNHLAVKLKGRPRGRRRRRARSQSHSSDPSSDCESEQSSTPVQTPRRLTLRNGPEKTSGDEKEEERKTMPSVESFEDRSFMSQLKSFYKSRNEILELGHYVKSSSMRALFTCVTSRGGFEAVCRTKTWRQVLAACDLDSSRPARTRKYYEKVLLPFENSERKNGLKLGKGKLRNGTSGQLKMYSKEPVTTIDMTGESPQRDVGTVISTIEKRLRTPSPKPKKCSGFDPSNLQPSSTETSKLDVAKDELDITSKPAELLNQEFLDSLPKPAELNDTLSKYGVKSVDKLFESKYPVESSLLSNRLTKDLGDGFVDQRGSGRMTQAELEAFVRNVTSRDMKKDEKEFSDLYKKFNLDHLGTSVVASGQHQPASDVLSSLSSLSDKYVSRLTNGQNGVITPHAAEQKPALRPGGVSGSVRSSLRSVRVKPTASRDNRSQAINHAPPAPPLRPDSASSSPPVLTNFGINYPPSTTTSANQPDNQSDDEIQEVPYKPKTPEIIDLDEYPESPQAVKKKKLDILKERGLEVTAVPNTWPTTPQLMPNPITSQILNQNPMLLNPALQHQIMTQAQLFQMYNIIPQNYPNGMQPPRVIQAKSIYGTSGPEKTVYGNPKDPFMPPPHILQGTPIKPTRNVQSTATSAQDILDLTCKTQTSPASSKPAVEIVRIPNIPVTAPQTSSAQNLSKNYTLMDGKAVVGSNLEITLVSPKHSPTKLRPPQKRSSNGKFISTKSGSHRDGYSKNQQSTVQNLVSSTSRNDKKPNITVPNYQVNPMRDDVSPTSSNSSRESSIQGHNQNHLLQNVFKNPNFNLMELQKSQMSNLNPFMDPMYMNALYNSLAGQLDQRQLAVYKEFMAGQYRGYSGLLNLGAVSNTSTTNN